MNGSQNMYDPIKQNHRKWNGTSDGQMRAWFTYVCVYNMQFIKQKVKEREVLKQLVN
jgi:hypothetical protein